MGLLTNIFNNYQEMDRKSPLCLTKEQREKLENDRDTITHEMEIKQYPQPVGEAVVVLHDLVSAKIKEVKKLKGVR